MPKSLRMLFIVLVLLSQSAFSQKVAGKEVTIVGEVIDTQCYLTNAAGTGNGNEHKECAISCATGGIPLSILQEQTDQRFDKVDARFDKVEADLRNVQSEVRGLRSDVGGLRRQAVRHRA